MGREAVVAVGDVSKRADVVKVVEKSVKEFGGAFIHSDQCGV